MINGKYNVSERKIARRISDINSLMRIYRKKLSDYKIEKAELISKLGGKYELKHYADPRKRLSTLRRRKK